MAKVFFFFLAEEVHGDSLLHTKIRICVGGGGLGPGLENHCYGEFPIWQRFFFFFFFLAEEVHGASCRRQIRNATEPAALSMEGVIG